jgi:hypothetical protein
VDFLPQCVRRNSGSAWQKCLCSCCSPACLLEINAGLNCCWLREVKYQFLPQCPPPLGNHDDERLPICRLIKIMLKKLKTDP